MDEDDLRYFKPIDHVAICSDTDWDGLCTSGKATIAWGIITFIISFSKFSVNLSSAFFGVCLSCIVPPL